MNNDTVLKFFFGFAILMFVVVLIVKGYSAHRQAAIYRQQGIEISTFDVMIGVKPNERVIQLKEK